MNKQLKKLTATIHISRLPEFKIVTETLGRIILDDRIPKDIRYGYYLEFLDKLEKAQKAKD